MFYAVGLRDKLALLWLYSYWIALPKAQRVAVAGWRHVSCVMARTTGNGRPTRDEPWGIYWRKAESTGLFVHTKSTVELRRTVGKTPETRPLQVADRPGFRVAPRSNALLHCVETDSPTRHQDELYTCRNTDKTSLARCRAFVLYLWVKYR